jgi:lysophospholipase L1-like esterase
MLPTLVRLIAFGDSLTEGFDPAGYFGRPMHPYTDALQRLLEERWPDVRFEITNYGKSGELAENMPLRLTRVFEVDKSPYDLFIALGGTNDIGYSASSHKDPAVNGAEVGTRIADAVATMVKTATEHGIANSLVMSVFEHGAEDRPSFGHSVVARQVLRERLAQLAAAEGSATTFFDLGAAMPFFGDAAGLFGDLLHPTKAGYDHMGKLVFEALIPQLERIIEAKKARVV